jgi:hypothetical protein
MTDGENGDSANREDTNSENSSVKESISKTSSEDPLLVTVRRDWVALALSIATLIIVAGYSY